MNKLSAIESEIFTLLRGVIDPELMISIIDLGLVYEVIVEESLKAVVINMTLTSPGCPMGDAIQEDVKQIILANYEDYTVSINLVWNPPWTLDSITEKGKEALGH